MYKKYLFSRKHNGEEYKFYLYRQYFYYGKGSVKEMHNSIHVETPKMLLDTLILFYYQHQANITPILFIDICQNGYFKNWKNR